MIRHVLAAGALGFATLTAMPAHAQFYWSPFGPRPPIVDYYPRPPGYVPGPLDDADDAYTSGEVMYLLRQQGYRVVSRPRRTGGVYVAEASTGGGQRVRIVVGAYDGDIRSTTVVPDRRAARPPGDRPGERETRAAIEPPIQGERPITVEPLAPPAAAPAPAPRANATPAAPVTPDAKPEAKPQRPAIVRPSRTPAKPAQPEPATQEAKPAPRVILPNPVQSTPLVPNEPLKVETPKPSPAPAPQVATPAIPPPAAAPAARAEPRPTAPVAVPPPSTLDEIKPKSPATETLPVPPVTLD
ncbi:MAG: hypothetical protein ACRCYS_07540 [Beijerinckiaceae bacterium]